MKTILICCVLSLFVGAETSTLPGNDVEKIVKKIIDTGRVEGHDEKVINGTGDATAAIITKLISGAPLKKEAIPRILDVLRHAFVGSTRTTTSKPAAALSLLDKLEVSTSDPDLKTQIQDTRGYVLNNGDRRP